MDFSDEMIDEIYKIFQIESEEIISRINNTLLDLEKNPKDKDAILILFRDAHSLKGASRMIGFNDVQTIAHKMEDVLGLAKDDKISLNSDVVNILYKTVDFLFELIQKSLQKKQQIYSEEISKQITILENVVNHADSVSQSSEHQSFDKESLINSIDNINNLIVESFLILMNIEAKKEGYSIENLLSKTTELYLVFEKMGSFDLKKNIEDINVKLKFTMMGTNELTLQETGEIHRILDVTITKLVSICDLYNIPTVDYYAQVFENMPKISFDFLEQEVIENKIDDEVSIFDSSIVTQSFVNFEDLKEKFEFLLQNSGSVQDINNILDSYSANIPNILIKTILLKIKNILDFSMKNEIRLSEEMISTFNESVDYCERVSHEEAADEDSELILQRLEIIQQLLDLNKQKTEADIVISPNIDKIKKMSEASDIFNTGEIKTLRVDSVKLDELINQLNELTIEKIKIKEHIQDLKKIHKDVDDWQKNLSKMLNYMRYYDKKYFQAVSHENSNLFLTKQLLNLFEDNSKKVQEISSNISVLHKTIQDDDSKLDVTVDNLTNMVKNIRILPFATIFHLFGRMVRDIAQEKNKKIDFQIFGSETSTDKKIIEEIKAPLIHIIRNAIDHGIESPEERQSLGKSSQGKIILSAAQVNNKIIIEIKDDGKGINIQKIREKALSKGFLSQQEIDSMSDEQLTNLIFAPGFSTGDEITSISGRGIGLDVVQTKISQLNGKVKVLSELNRGCCIQIELPTKMAILRVFIAKVSGQIFAIPMDMINSVLRKHINEIITKNGRDSILFENEPLSLYSLADILKLKKTEEKPKKTIVILESDNKKIAISVDELLGEQEILQKKMSAPFYKLKHISGLTTLVSGDICMILNVSDLMKSAYSTAPIKSISENIAADNKFFKILLVDDSTTTITLEKTILTKSGYVIETASHPIEAIEKIKKERFDLVITDYEMPHMNGLEFIEKIKTDEMFSDIPFIVVSSIVDEEFKSRVISAGATKYIVKGEFNQQDFQKAVDEILH